MPSDATDPGVLRERLSGIVGEEHVGAGAGETSAFAVDGVVPGLTVRPGTQEEVSRVVAACATAGATMIPWGGGTSMGTGNRPSRVDVVVRTERLDRLVELDADNLCVTVEAGMPLSRLREVLAAKKEFLPLDPPSDDSVTIGGLVSANLSGPGRLLYGTCRDWVLGMRVVLPDGERVRSGGRVIKNVSGYDLNKLFIRSHGTLGIVTEVTLKLLPAPVVRAGAIGLFADPGAAKAAVGKVLGSFLLPEALDLLDPAATALLAPRLGYDAPAGTHALAVAFAGSPGTVERQLRDFTSFLRDGGGSVTSFPGEESVAAWDGIRNVLGLVVGPRVVCRIAVPIGRTAEMLALATALGVRLGLDGAAVAHAGSGVVHAAFPLGALSPVAPALVEALEELRRAAVATKGSLVLVEAPASLKGRIDAWGRPGPGFEAISRLKAEFDPRSLCSPGRFLGGI